MQEVLPPERSWRPRHDGWTLARRDAFCEALAKGSTVTEACAIVGKSTTSAYKARDRVLGFRNRWDEAIEQAKPDVEAEVFRRAIQGWDEPVFHAGKQVGVRRRYSDSLLRMLYQRGVQSGASTVRRRASIEEVEHELLKRLDRMSKHAERERVETEAADRAAAAEAADRMRAAGLCP